jgi:hypothetical protein
MNLLSIGKRSSLFCSNSSDEEKKFCQIDKKISFPEEMIKYEFASFVLLTHQVVHSHNFLRIY